MKNYVREVYKTREAWLTCGRGIGGSTAAAIVGLSPWLSKLELYNTMIGNTPRKPDTDSPVLAFGRAMEPLIRKQFALDHPEYKIRAPRGFEMYRRKDVPVLTATVDGLLTEIKTGRKGIWECKTHDIRNKEDAAMWESNALPPQYLIQVYHYLLVLNDCDFVDVTARQRYFRFDGESMNLDKVVTKTWHIEREDVEPTLLWLNNEELTFVEHLEYGIPPDGEIKF